MQIILHIGQKKTASTIIQAYLAQNREQLAAQRVLYPRALGPLKATLISDLIGAKSSLEGSRETLISNLETEFSGDYTRALLSNENMLTGMSPQVVKDTLEPYASSWRVLCYVRRPDEHIASFYQQQVKGTYVRPFDSFFKKRMRDTYYCYAHMIDQWAEVFGRDAVEVRVFHPKTLKGHPVADFTQWVGLDPEGLSFDAEQQINEALDRVNTELLRLLHLCLVEQPELARRHDLTQIVPRLRALDTGERLRLDAGRARRLQHRFKNDHERLAERYLSPEHAAVLLAPPAEVEPSPLDHDALVARFMMLFNDPDLARFALERAEQRTSQKSISKELIRPPREERAANIIGQFDQEPDEASAPVTAASEEHSTPRRTSKSILGRIAKIFRSKQ